MKLLLCIAAALMATTATAQRPVSAGTTSALGGTGATEARRADALLFNPALLGIWDGGPAASHSFLSLDLARLPSEGTFDGLVRLGLIGGEGATGAAICSTPARSRTGAPIPARWTASPGALSRTAISPFPSPPTSPRTWTSRRPSATRSAPATP